MLGVVPDGAEHGIGGPFAEPADPGLILRVVEIAFEIQIREGMLHVLDQRVNVVVLIAFLRPRTKREVIERGKRWGLPRSLE